jgi:hypothetical protein
VLDDVDPVGQRRLQVEVPDVFGDGPVWAAASLPVGAEDLLPGVGEAVWVSFEHGDSDYPVWERALAGQGRAMADRGYLGKYHGVVTDADDPLYQRPAAGQRARTRPDSGLGGPRRGCPRRRRAAGAGVWRLG